MEKYILIEHIKSVLNLSEKQIREKFAEYPVCLMEYIDQEVNEKSIEVRFDKEEATLTCIFDDEGVCSQVFLFSDKIEMLEELITLFEKFYTYDCIRNKWIASDYSIRVKPIARLTGDYCLFFKSNIY